jgi:hypothetical protein
MDGTPSVLVAVFPYLGHPAVDGAGSYRGPGAEAPPLLWGLVPRAEARCYSRSLSAVPYSQFPIPLALLPAFVGGQERAERDFRPEVTRIQARPELYRSIL